MISPGGKGEEDLYGKNSVTSLVNIISSLGKRLASKTDTRVESPSQARLTRMATDSKR